jgi:hypothetical protein
MSVKKVVIVSMLLAIWVPFVLLTDLYPFFRFGMFAEPVKQSIQMEQFAVGYVSLDESRQVLSPGELGISSLAYLMRNYYYRNQATAFLQHIHTIYTGAGSEKIQQWQLLRITSPYGVYQPDTTVVATYRLSPVP